MNVTPDPTLRGSHRRLTLPVGAQADAVLIVHQTLQGDDVVVQGFTVYPCDCHLQGALAKSGDGR